MTVMSYRIDIFRRLNMCGRYYFDGDTYRLVGRVIEDCQYDIENMKMIFIQEIVFPY